MWNLDDEAKRCIAQVAHLGIPIGSIQGFYTQYKLRGAWGVCRLREDGAFDIFINARLLSGDVPVESLRATITHEILHTCPGCFNHGRIWKQYATVVTDTYGYRICRTNTIQEKGIRSGEKKTVIEKVPASRQMHFYVGDYVEHRLLGPGIVTAVKPVGSDALITVGFQDMNSRQFMRTTASAHLRLIDCERLEEHRKAHIQYVEKET